MSHPIDAIAETRRDTARRLDAIFREATGWQPRLWGKLIGYGQYRYRYASGREGITFATGFGVGAREITLHILPGYNDFPGIAARLGPHRRGKSCWYLRSLDNADAAALHDLIRAGLDDLAAEWPVEPS